MHKAVGVWQCVEEERQLAAAMMTRRSVGMMTRATRMRTAGMMTRAVGQVCQTPGRMWKGKGEGKDVLLWRSVRLR